MQETRSRGARPLLWAALALAAAALTAPALAPARAQEADTPAAARAARTTARTVFVVRHAEKGAGDPRDPELSEAGAARARELARLLSAAGVTHLFASEYRRTRATLAPLAEATGVAVEPISAREPDALLARLRALPEGAVACVAGHSNTVPALVAALGGEVEGLVDSPYGPLIEESAYDRLFALTLLPGEEGDAAPRCVACVELRYGD